MFGSLAWSWKALGSLFSTSFKIPGFHPCVGKILWRREWLPTPMFWQGEFHGLYSPWGCKELDIAGKRKVSLSLSSSNSLNSKVFSHSPKPNDFIWPLSKGVHPYVHSLEKCRVVRDPVEWLKSWEVTYFNSDLESGNHLQVILSFFTPHTPRKIDKNQKIKTPANMGNMPVSFHTEICLQRLFQNSVFISYSV